MIVRAQRRPGFESDRRYLDVYDRCTGSRRTVFETPDLSVTDFTLCPTATSIVFTATEPGHRQPVPGPARGRRATTIVGGGSIPSPGRRQFAVFSKSALTSPAELSRRATGGRHTAAHTARIATWLKEVDFQKPESLTVPGAGGTQVQVLADQAA